MDNMSESIEMRATSSPIVTPADFAEAGLESGRPDRRRRNFLRQAAMAALAIPGIGRLAQAADDKKKSKDGSAKPAAAKHAGSTKLGPAHTDSIKPDAAHGSAKTSPAHAGVTKQSLGQNGASNGKGPKGIRPGGSARPLARSPEQINRTSVRTGNSGATPDGSNAHGGKPLPELYKNWDLHNFEQIQADENAHVAFLVNALGSYARPMPVFQNLEQPTVHQFAVTARALENTGVGAYLGALPLLASSTTGQQYLAAAGSIALIEARHAGFLNSLIDLSLDENINGDVTSFDAPLTPEDVVSLASPFIESLNGGPPLIPTGGFTNPLDILNFALALEYLEAAYYNINVPNLRKTLAK
jgi:hypothetical protein